MEPSLRIIVLTRYTRRGASSRLRFLQYVPELERHGLTLQHEPLFSDSYIDVLESGRSKHYKSVCALVRRIATMCKERYPDAIWIEKDALPWLPACLEVNLIPKGIPLVMDYDDAVFHHYDMHPNRWVRRLLAGKHQVLMRRATLVIAANQYIADYAEHAGARRVELLPTVIDLNRYKPLYTQPDKKTEMLPVVGWIGQRSTAKFLRPLASVFEQLSNEGLIYLRAIGIDTTKLGVPMVSEAWSEGTEVASIQQLDIGIMPLDDGPFERGKSGYKLIQYMACGLPVVASPVGVNTSIVEHGINGFLVNSLEEWEWALRTLAADPMLRNRMGQAGRAKIEREYSLQFTAPLFADWLAEIVKGRV